MAEYFSPTVVQPPIPERDVTPLERLLLSHMFDCELCDEGLYFFSQETPREDVVLSRDELRRACDASRGIPSTVYDYVHAQAAIDDGDPAHVEIDMSGTSWEFIFQDVVRRSPTLRYVTVVSAFTCTKMRPDGFGGMAVLITAGAIKGKSTADILLDLLEEAGEST